MAGDLLLKGFISSNIFKVSFIRQMRKPVYYFSCKLILFKHITVQIYIIMCSYVLLYGRQVKNISLPLANRPLTKILRHYPVLLSECNKGIFLSEFFFIPQTFAF